LQRDGVFLVQGGLAGEKEMNQRGIEPERTDKSFSDSGEVLTNLFRNAEATQEIRKRKTTRGLDHKSKVLTKSLSEESNDRAINTSEFGKTRAKRTSTNNAKAGYTKEKRPAQKKSLPSWKILKVGLMLVLMGLVVSILLTQIASWVFTRSGQALYPIKKGIIRASVPPKQKDKAFEKKPAETIPKKFQEKFGTAKQGIQAEKPNPKTTILHGDNIPEIKAVPGGRLDTHPYSIYLGSFKTIDRARRAVSIFQRKGISPYWVKIDLGPKGEWYRVFAGHFQSRHEAEAFAIQNGIGKGNSRHTRYANLIGTYGSEEGLNEMRLTLLKLGYCPYVIEGTDGRCHLYTGAFYQHARAKKEHTELTLKGIQSQLVDR
jgi:cell division septation protein DedD